MADSIMRDALRLERFEAALHRLQAPVPSTKGMAPKDRAQRLHSEMERRIAIARDALLPRSNDPGEAGDG